MPRAGLLKLIVGATLSVSLMVTACNSPAQTANSLGEQGRRNVTPAAIATAAALPHPGRLLASNCFQCHGTDGKGPGFDSLAGESVSELVSEMQELRTETDLDELIMRAHAESYTDAQIRLIAEYFAQVK